MEGGSKCFAYVRTSRQNITRRKLTISDQKSMIEKYCGGSNFNKEKITLTRIFQDENKSIKGRPLELTKLLNIISAKDILIVSDLSRICKTNKNDVEMLKMLKEKQCLLIIVMHDFRVDVSSDLFNLDVVSNFNLAETNEKKNRRLVIRESKLEKGEFIGKVPYGWRSVKNSESKVAEIKEEQLVISFIYKLSCEIDVNNQRKMTDHAIAKKLNELGVTPPGNSKTWHGSYVTRILNRNSGPPLSKTTSKYKPKKLEELNSKSKPLETKVVWQGGFNFVSNMK